MLEIITSIVLIFCVFLTGKQNIASWILNIMSCLLLAFFYFSVNLYAQVVLQTLFIIQCFFGLYNWSRKDSDIVHEIGTRKALMSFFAISVISIIGISLFHIDNTMSRLDLFTSFLGLLANFYLTKKIIESWILFITFNVIMIYMMSLNHNYLMVFVNIILITISINSYFLWKKDLKTV